MAAFELTRGEVKLLTGDTSDYEDPAQAMAAVLALDSRMRDFLATPEPEGEPRIDPKTGIEDSP